MASGRPVLLTILDMRTILRVLNGKLHLGLTQENILTPTAEVAQQVFYNFVRYVLSVPESSLTTLPLTADVDVDNEMNRKSIPLVIVYQCMKAFIKDNTGGKLDLTMCDFVTPAKIQNRFKKLTSFLADFIRLHDMAMPLWNEISDEFGYRKHELESLQSEVMAVEKRKDDLLAQQSLRKRREHELINEHNKVKSELNKIIGQYNSNKSAAEERSKQKEEAIELIEKVENDVISGKKMVEHLSGEVLSSPEELKAEMEARRKQIEELRDCLRHSKKTLQNKEEALKICAEAEKNVPVLIDKINSWSELQEEIAELIDVINDNMRKLAELEENLQLTIEKKKKVGERMDEQAKLQTQLRRQHFQRNEDLQHKIEEITAEISALGKNQPDVSRDIERKRQELLLVKNALSEDIAELTNWCHESMSKFRKVQELFGETHRIALEKQTAGKRAKHRVRNAIFGPLPTEYTFDYTKTLSMDENDVGGNGSSVDFKVFK
uniref:Kinetochore protein Nuf2 N-terminal domain-containing protein n=1 Tax=Caenorhabditis japonica TaxID=281687 RepID=A0A8R1DEU4_CAEJA